MKKILFIIYLTSIIGYTQTQITDSNIQTAVNTCLASNPVDGLCSNSEYGAMSNWDVSNVTNMQSVFANKTNFNGDISLWDVSNVNNMVGMFSYSTNFNGNISTWDVSNVTNMQAMFAYASEFNQDLNNWNVGNVNTMRFMFQHAKKFNQDLNNWDVSNVTNMEWMFSDAKKFNQDLNNWDVSNVIDMGDMFSEADAFNGVISTWNVASTTRMDYMFLGADSFNRDLSNWDVSKVNKMSLIFGDTSLSTDNYDNILIAWSKLTLQQEVLFGARNINYCNSKDARQKIIDTFNWTVSDGGLDCSTAKIKDFENNLFKIYPNPTGDFLIIKSNNEIISSTVYNILGKKVLSIKNAKKLDVQKLSSGVYTIRISDSTNQTIQKFIKL